MTERLFSHAHRVHDVPIPRCGSTVLRFIAPPDELEPHTDTFDLAVITGLDQPADGSDAGSRTA